ncbi:MAG: thermonuclease family protein [Pseudomonadota bacterium]
MKMMPLMLIVIGAAIILVFMIVQKRGKPLKAGQIKGTVDRVVDGDSLYIKTHDPQIRLWGLDAPERNEEGYKEATKQLYQLAYNKTITCEIMDVDRYGRTVSRCKTPDGSDLSAEMIRSGTAKEYIRFTKGYYSNVTPKP